MPRDQKTLIVRPPSSEAVTQIVPRPPPIVSTAKLRVINSEITEPELRAFRTTTLEIAEHARWKPGGVATLGAGVAATGALMVGAYYVQRELDDHLEACARKKVQPEIDRRIAALEPELAELESRLVTPVYLNVRLARLSLHTTLVQPYGDPEDIDSTSLEVVDVSVSTEPPPPLQEASTSGSWMSSMTRQEFVESERLH
jgi:hypothetical protein